MGNVQGGVGNVQGGGCFSIFQRADVQGGVFVNVFTPPPFTKSCIRAWGRYWAGTQSRSNVSSIKKLYRYSGADTGFSEGGGGVMATRGGGG